jgi:riboflavin kinase/FMN adenylyltransferase
MTTHAALARIDDATSPASLAAVPCSLVVGNFDGVHRGHQAVLREAIDEARKAGLAACVLTFDPHPAAVVGRGAPPMLTTLERRVELMEALGVDRVYVRAFDAAFAAWSPDRFARELVAGALQARIVVVGQNFRFGAKRAGDLALLRALGAELGFDARVHAIAADAHGRFSSTRAREAIAAGDLDEAERVLGRPHALTGAVVHGDERGRTIGFPTANLDPVPEILPPDGVYAVRVEQREAATDEWRALAGGVTNIGVRPTVDGARRTIEAHLLDFAGDLYGSRLRLNLVARLREEKRFASLDELKAQIGRDVATARTRLATLTTLTTPATRR